MVSLDILLKILCWHLIPSMSTVILTTGFIILIIRIFRIESPRWQYWLFFVPLVKGLVVLINGVRPWPSVLSSKPYVFGIRLWDPLNIISLPSAFDAFPRTPTAVEQMIIACIFILFLALIFRWVSLFAFYRTLGGIELHPEDAPRLFQTLDRLVDEMHTPYPKVKITDKPYILPCLVGVMKPTIILSPGLAEESSEEILEAILAHELAHLKRHDNLFHWISVIIRDLLVVNPFVHLMFPRILDAKEQDCDRIAADATGKPKTIARAIVYAATEAGTKGMKPLPGNMSGVSESLSPGRLINRRIDMLMADDAMSCKKTSLAKSIIVIFSALFIFLIHFVAGFPATLSPIILF